jgi:hypothetical protein
VPLPNNFLKLMIKEEQITEVTTVKHRYCDECGTRIRIGMACSRASCEICGKDLCDKCVGHEDHSYGDYRVVYCKRCWEVGEEYRTQILVHETEIDRLNDEWRDKCKNAEKKNILNSFVSKLSEGKDLDPEISEIVNKNFKELLL